MQVTVQLPRKTTSRATPRSLVRSNGQLSAEAWNAGQAKQSNQTFVPFGHFE